MRERITLMVSEDLHKMPHGRSAKVRDLIKLYSHKELPMEYFRETYKPKEYFMMLTLDESDKFQVEEWAKRYGKTRAYILRGFLNIVNAM